MQANRLVKYSTVMMSAPTDADVALRGIAEERAPESVALRTASSSPQPEINAQLVTA